MYIYIYILTPPPLSCSPSKRTMHKLILSIQTPCYVGTQNSRVRTKPAPLCARLPYGRVAEGIEMCTVDLSPNDSNMTLVPNLV